MPPKRRSSRQAAKKKKKEQEQQQAQQQQQQQKKEQKKEQEEVQVVEDKVPLVAPETPDDPRVPVLSVLHGAVHLLWRGVRQRDNLVLRRALRRATGQRSKLGSEVLSHLVSNVLEDGDAVRSDLLVRLESEAYDAVDVSEIRALLPEGGALPSMVDLSVAAAMRMREEVEKEVERKKQEKIKAQKAKEEAAEAKDGNKSAAAKKKKKKEEEEAAAAAKKKEADSEGADAAKDDDGDVVMSAEDAAALAKQKAEEAAAAARAEAAEGVDPEQEIARDDVIHETHFFFKLLVVMFLLDRKKPAAALALCQGMVQQIPTLNRRSLDVLSAKVYFYFALAHELEGTLGETRPALLEAHRTACLHHDEPSQIALTNALLRSLVRDKLIRQADKFRLHTRLPGNVPSPQMARYLFYKGVINAVQLHYSEAFDDLTQAVRKAPRKGAVGFRQLVTKNLIVVQLLMGDIPERSVFRQADLERSLRPYFQITRAVREGNLQLFSQATEKFGSNFRADQTLTLINRLRHNVIKTGLRNINVSYSRISLADVCKRLKLDSEADAEYIVAKAIHDGVIDAAVDHEGKFVYSSENPDIYSTEEPLTAFNQRTHFCLEVHNEAVRGLRYPPNAHKPKHHTIDDNDDGDDLEELLSAIAEDAEQD